MILGIDVGGTFAGFVRLDDVGRVRSGWLRTSARDPSTALLQGIANLEAGPKTTVVHGAIVATNGLLDRRGAQTALAPSEGSGDVLELGRPTCTET